MIRGFILISAMLKFFRATSLCFYSFKTFKVFSVFISSYLARVHII